MNCDGVFDILTRGPFPTGDSSDGAVERHLAACHECRQLAEALRPAVELFHEAIPPEEGASLPGYRGALATAEGPGGPTLVAAAVGQSTFVTRLRGRAPWELPPVARSAALRLAAVGLLAAALCLLLFGVAAPPDDASSARLASPRATDSAAAAGAAGLRHLASLDLPPQCFPGNRSAATGPSRHVQCCTQCHGQGIMQQPSLTGDNLVTLVNSCRECHES